MKRVIALTAFVVWVIVSFIFMVIDILAILWCGMIAMVVFGLFTIYVVRLLKGLFGAGWGLVIMPFAVGAVYLYLQ